jgi:multidrug efflux system membrane fusion protein
MRDHSSPAIAEEKMAGEGARPTRFIPCARIGAALLFPLVLVACSGKKSGPPPAVPVVTAVAEARDLPLSIRAVGSVEPIESASVRAQVTGIITAVSFREGEDVREGQLLFQLDPRPFRAALNQTEAQLRRDRAQLENAETQAKRYAGLVQKDYVTREQADAVRTQAEALRAVVASNEEAVVRARLDLEYASVRAPISGRAGAALAKKGNTVKANEAVLVTINQIRPIRVAFAVPGGDLPTVRRYGSVGPLAVKIHPTGGTETLAEGVLTFVDNQVDAATGTVTLKAQCDNADGALWPGQFVEAELVLDMEKGVVAVPDPAVVQGQRGAFLWVVKGDVAERREVTVNRSAQGWTVVEPLRAGEVVVTDGQSRLAISPKGEPPRVEPKGNGPQGGAGKGDAKP